MIQKSLNYLLQVLTFVELLSLLNLLLSLDHLHLLLPGTLLVHCDAVCPNLLSQILQGGGLADGG